LPVSSCDPLGTGVVTRHAADLVGRTRVVRQRERVGIGLRPQTGGRTGSEVSAGAG
jgi:hypothetical protein